MAERIGIVIQHWNGEKIDGYRGEADDVVRLKKDSTIEVQQCIYKVYFSYNLITGILTISSITDWETAKSVGYELRNIGFENVKLQFEDGLYQIDNSFGAFPIKQQPSNN